MKKKIPDSLSTLLARQAGMSDVEHGESASRFIASMPHLDNGLFDFTIDDRCREVGKYVAAWEAALLVEEFLGFDEPVRSVLEWLAGAPEDQRERLFGAVTDMGVVAFSLARLRSRPAIVKQITGGDDEGRD